MAPLLDRFRRRRADVPANTNESAPQSPPPPRRRPLPPPSLLRRQRRALLHARDERVRDLGGLVLEMYRQDRFRQDLVYEQAAEVVEIEERLYEVDRLLLAATTRGRSSGKRCKNCGAELFPGDTFCPNCGHAAAETSQ